MKKYNIALVPKNNVDKFVSLIKEQKNVNTYCIGNNSIPHVTICHFYSESEFTEHIWEEVCNDLEETSMNLSFRKYSNITFDNNIYWLSLIPEEDKQLHRIFTIVSQHVTPIRQDAYDPHLTLFNYLNKDLINHEILKTEFLIEDEFILILGESDKIGQLLSVIFIAQDTKNNINIKY